MSGKKHPDDGTEVLRSVGAVMVWWVWVVFAAGNLIDLAVQGRGHLSLMAAFILLFVTGIVYVAAKRPRVVADDAGLVIVNPVRDHRVGWTTVAGVDPTDLLRIRCEWPAGDGTKRRAIYSWAVHSSRRRQVAAEMRARRLPQRGGGSAGVFGSGAGGFAVGGFGGMLGTAADPAPAPESDPLRLDVGKIVASFTERAERARLAAPEAEATAPVSTWDWRAVAAVAVPGLALLVVALT